MIRPTRARGTVSVAASLFTLGMTFMAYSPWVARYSVKPNPAFPVNLGPARRLGAEEGVELRRRCGGGEDAGLLQAVGDGRIGIGADHVLMDFLHDGRGRAGGSD